MRGIASASALKVRAFAKESDVLLSCKEIVRLISSDERLSLMRRAELRLHLMMCEHCGRYKSQLQTLARAAVRLLDRRIQESEDDIKKIEEEVIDRTKKTG